MKKKKKKEVEVQTFSSRARSQGQCYTDLGIVGTQAIVEAKRKNAHWERMHPGLRREMLTESWDPLC